MPVVSGLRAAGHGRVLVELDGASWRTVPSDVVVEVGLAVGSELDRPQLRVLRRALRRHEALARAAEALRHREQSAARLRERLERRVAPAAAAEALAALGRAGLVEDGRYARARAASLARRGLGDAAIRFELERDGVGAGDADCALEELPAERERAVEIVRRRGGGVGTARFLHRRGFSEETLETVLGSDIAPDERSAVP
jgi:SOS response regulatory protein OraA/RecX